MQSATPKVLLPSVWPLPVSLAATSGISFDFSSSAYLDVSVQRVFLHITILFIIWCCSIATAGSPIRTSADLWIFAPPRSFSQLVTSFFGSWCQGILRMLFFAWPRRHLLRFTQNLLSANSAFSPLCLLFRKKLIFFGCFLKNHFSRYCQTLLRTISFSLSSLRFYVSKFCSVFL